MNISDMITEFASEYNVDITYTVDSILDRYIFAMTSREDSKMHIKSSVNRNILQYESQLIVRSILNKMYKELQQGAGHIKDSTELSGGHLW